MAKPFLCRPKARSEIEVDYVKVMEGRVLDFVSMPLDNCLKYSVQFWYQKDACRLETIQR